jgi:hypothetical protein
MEEVLHQLVDVLSPKYNPMRFTIHRPKVTLPGAGFRKIIRQFHRCQSRTQYTRQRADSALRQEAIGIASHQDFPHRLKPGLLRGSMLTCFFLFIRWVSPIPVGFYSSFPRLLFSRWVRGVPLKFERLAPVMRWSHVMKDMKPLKPYLVESIWNNME